jgi:hypothetical protein
MLIVSNMKGWLTLCLSVVVIGAVLSETGCSADSGWNAGMNGVTVNPEANQAPTGAREPPQSPPGSGAVDYVPQGPFQ